MSNESLHNRDVLNSLCEIISDPAVVLDADGVFVDVIHNAHNGALFFKQPETLLGTDLWDIFSTAQADQFYTVIEDALQAGKQQQIEYQLTLDSGVRHFEARVAPVGSGNTDRVLWLAEDITQRKRREEKQALIERVFEISPVGLVIVEPSGKISRANDRAEDLLGLEHNTITERRYDQPEWNIFYEDGTPIPDSEHPVTRVLESGDPVFGFEHWIELADGTERWLSSNAAPILGDDGTIERVIVGLDDATSMKQREEQLEWLVGTETLADIGGWELDLETDLIEGTTGMKRLYGTSQYNPTLDEAIEQYHPNDRAALRDAIETCRETGEPIELEARRKTAGETERWFRLRAEKTVQDGTPKLRGIVRDITQDKEREQRIMVMSRILRHNIRNKLTVIRGNSRLLKEELASSDSSVDAARGHIDRIENASKELDSLAERARSFDRVIERDLRSGTVHLRQVLTDVQEALTEQHPELTIEVASTEAEVSGDRMAIDLILEILLENALEYSDVSDPTVALTAEETPAGQATVRVDTDKSDIPDIERRVLSSETEGPIAHSRGLGLWAVTWLVRRLGGSVTLDEDLDGGTRVELAFPLARSE
ncbi:PAS domain S-box protein [Haloarcula sp. CBA1130]|uniref:sensor histidine kinase n=1 Tax=unclassified Haloarcula TaxID=2624677 RepID=UPI0012462E76|nr:MULTISPECIES: PAS domain-containing protein [unclassified Haloarcula]KAA9398208.1 PAS domain S-box protein [Haloarcula sp. CBA1129]KAA9402105.1 PAS domain S-box protein [Haloarcula sp. CBA1130]